MSLNHKVLDRKYLILTEIQVHNNSPYMFGNGLQRRGKSWTVLLGRRDGNVSISINGTDAALPSAFDTLDVIISKFKRVGLNEKDVVSLSGTFNMCSQVSTKIAS